MWCCASRRGSLPTLLHVASEANADACLDHRLLGELAHLVDRWGDDFRTDYSRIADIRRLPPATSSPAARRHRRTLDQLDVPADVFSDVSGGD